MTQTLLFSIHLFFCSLVDPFCLFCRGVANASPPIPSPPSLQPHSLHPQHLTPVAACCALSHAPSPKIPPFCKTQMCMVQNESEHLSPATYRQRHRQRHRWRIAGDCSVFFPYFVFAGDFLEGGEGGGREGKRWRWGGGGERKRWRWGGRLKEKK